MSSVAKAISDTQHTTLESIYDDVMNDRLTIMQGLIRAHSLGRQYQNEIINRHIAGQLCINNVVGEWKEG